jgi:hypothetical protein
MGEEQGNKGGTKPLHVAAPDWKPIHPLNRYSRTDPRDSADMIYLRKKNGQHFLEGQNGVASQSALSPRSQKEKRNGVILLTYVRSI